MGKRRSVPEAKRSRPASDALVQFRAGSVLYPELRARAGDGSLAHVAKRDLLRYYALVRSGAVTEGEDDKR